MTQRQCDRQQSPTSNVECPNVDAGSQQQVNKRASETHLRESGHGGTDECGGGGGNDVELHCVELLLLLLLGCEGSKRKIMSSF